jgi:hypothetical protein
MAIGQTGRPRNTGGKEGRRQSYEPDERQEKKCWEGVKDENTY